MPVLKFSTIEKIFKYTKMVLCHIHEGCDVDSITPLHKKQWLQTWKLWFIMKMRYEILSCLQCSFSKESEKPKGAGGLSISFFVCKLMGYAVFERNRSDAAASYLDVVYD